MKSFFKSVVLISLFAGMPLIVSAQSAAPLPEATYQPLADAQLDQMLGPIALYPDPLIAQILPASTFPTEIVLADRYLIGGGDPGQLDQQPWDSSVQAVAHYPTVLKWMDDNLSETTELGQAFLHQQQAVMASIQRLRTAAYNLGNLPSTPQQQVTDDNGNIAITPTDPTEIYVPDYQPDQVYDDSPDGYPFITFGVGYPIGGWLDYDCDWGGGSIIIWDSHHPRPDHWWHHPHDQRPPGNPTVWHGGDHPGTGTPYRGHSSWGTPAPSPGVIHEEQTRQAPLVNARPSNIFPTTPGPFERPAPAPRPESNNVFQEPRSTQPYIERSPQSTRSYDPPAAVPRSAPTGGGEIHYSGGGGGGGGGGGSHSGGGGNR